MTKDTGDCDEVRRAILAAGIGLVAPAAAAAAARGPVPAGPNTPAPTPDAPAVLTERWMLPFSQRCSPEARAVMASFVNADGTHKTTEQDKSFGIAFIDRIMAAQTKGLTSSVETIRIGDVVVYVATPKELVSPDRVYLEIHGGGFIFGGGKFCEIGGRQRADLHGVTTYAVDYRLAPQHPYPAALDDCMVVYRQLLRKYRPENIVIGGGSAGGNLTAALILRARDEGLPMPAGAALIDPGLEISGTADSYKVFRDADVINGPGLPKSGPLSPLYSGDHDPRHPYISPTFGDFSKGFPPTFMNAGTRSIHLSSVAIMQAALRRAGVPVEVHLFEGLCHGWFLNAPEDLEVDQLHKAFAASCWAGKWRKT